MRKCLVVNVSLAIKAVWESKWIGSAKVASSAVDWAEVISAF